MYYDAYYHHGGGGDETLVRFAITLASIVSKANDCFCSIGQP